MADDVARSVAAVVVVADVVAVVVAVAAVVAENCSNVKKMSVTMTTE